MMMGGSLSLLLTVVLPFLIVAFRLQPLQRFKNVKKENNDK